MPARNPPHDVKSSLVLLCEGAADQELFRCLINLRNLPLFDVKVANGKDGFGDLLNALAGASSFDALRGVLIVADADNGPEQAFREVRGGIARATAFWTKADSPGPPDHIGSVTVGCPGVAVNLMPANDRAGSLESLCVDVARARHYDWLGCVDPFLHCINVAELSPGRAAKASLRCMMLAAAPDAANTSLANLLHRRPDVFPLDDPAFDGPANMLMQFAVEVSQRALLEP